MKEFSEHPMNIGQRDRDPEVFLVVWTCKELSLQGRPGG